MLRNAILLLILCISLARCTKPYEPIVITTDYNFLVVDGNINAAPNGQTTVYLSRTRTLTDTVIASPESNAVVRIESESGESYFLDLVAEGTFQSQPLSLNNANRYRIRVTTGDQQEYTSEYVVVKQAPPIDSVTYVYNDDVSIFLNTRDPSNNTRYYRWEFDETYQYFAVYQTNLGYRNKALYFKDSAELVERCWKSLFSTNILLGSSAALSEDVISMAPITMIPRGSLKITAKYSINVRQFALTEEAYSYWQIILKNTENLGSLFDAQPSQLFGNIKNVNDPDEPVIGFVSASNVSEKRLFIRYADLPNWHVNYDPIGGCPVKVIPTDSASAYLEEPTEFAPAYFVGNGGAFFAFSFKKCSDCTLAVPGGTTKRPPFWQ
jgi:hypothetical protein